MALLNKNVPELEKIEIELVLRAVSDSSGYDLSNYAKASLRRRLHDFRIEEGLDNLSEIIPLIIHDEKALKKLIYKISVTVTEMFRDPHVFKVLREDVLSYLKTYPFVRIWVAGCSTGEEVYSLAVMLAEEGLYDKCQIYATDLNDAALSMAREGIYSGESVKNYSVNYRKSGGKNTLTEYFYSKYDSVIISRDLKKNITFAKHNLVTDSAFNEMNLIMCRNVMIYFNQILQNRVLKLFRDSLYINGFLCLGVRESISLSNMESNFTKVNSRDNIYKRIR